MQTVQLESLTVRYGAFTALDDFTAELPAGCVGLLGPNGAGKTTLLKTILGFLEPTHGSGKVLGLDVATQRLEIRQRIGYMPEQDCHIPGISAVQFVAYTAQLGGLPPAQALRRAHEVLEYTGLGEARYRPVETYSTGMRQRIKLAQALVHGPKLLLLDEPTNGLDPRGREDMLKLVKQISTEQGVNVVLCSHLLPDVERVCEYVVVLLGGRLRAAGPIQNLRSIVGQPVDVELREPSEAFEKAVMDKNFLVLDSNGPRYRVQSDLNLAQTNRELLHAALEAGAQIRTLGLAKRSLEEAFMEAVGG